MGDIGLAIACWIAACAVAFWLGLGAGFAAGYRRAHHRLSAACREVVLRATGRRARAGFSPEEIALARERRRARKAVRP